MLLLTMINLIWSFERVLSKHHALCILPYKTNIGKQGAERLLDCVIGSVSGYAHGLYIHFVNSAIFQ